MTYGEWEGQCSGKGMADQCQDTLGSNNPRISPGPTSYTHSTVSLLPVLGQGHPVPPVKMANCAPLPETYVVYGFNSGTHTNPQENMGLTMTKKEMPQHRCGEKMSLH